jgi:hypothetical protein
MKPKEKAEEICKKMLYQIEWNAQPSTVKGVAKECALIAVTEIINSNPHSNPFNTDVYPTMQYWIEVKQEIEKL